MNNVQKINYGPLGADLRIIIDVYEKGMQKVPTLGGEQQMSFAIDDFDP